MDLFHLARREGTPESSAVENQKQIHNLRKIPGLI